MKTIKQKSVLSLEKKTVRRLTKNDQTKLNGGQEPVETTWPISDWWPF